ncbi:MAG: MarR family transcriptional regulator [Actinomycetota bacterium]
MQSTATDTRFAAAGGPAASEFQDAVLGFVREFGLQRSDTTPCGMPMSISQAHALTELAAPGGLTQSELGAALNLSKSTVSRLVGQLQERGWIDRDRGRYEDGRIVQLTLTTSGKRLAATVADARHTRLTRLLDRIPKAEQPAVVRALRTLTKAANE